MPSPLGKRTDGEIGTLLFSLEKAVNELPTDFAVCSLSGDEPCFSPPLVFENPGQCQGMECVYHGTSIIKDFTDHAANERTFLAWIRTGISVIASRFMLEKFDPFIRALAANARGALEGAVKLNRFSGISRYEGLAFMATGVALLDLGSWRFVRLEGLIDVHAQQNTGGVRAEIALALILMRLVSAYCISIVTAGLAKRTFADSMGLANCSNAKSRFLIMQLKNHRSTSFRWLGYKSARTAYALSSTVPRPSLCLANNTR